MSCEDLEPFINLTWSYGKGYAVRHRRNCGVAMRSICAPSAGGSVMDESEYKGRRRLGLLPGYPIPSDHVCMKRWIEHGNEAARRTLRKMGEPELV
jgi:hypothetical protein